MSTAAADVDGAFGPRLATAAQTVPAWYTQGELPPNWREEWLAWTASPEAGIPLPAPPRFPLPDGVVLAPAARPVQPPILAPTPDNLRARLETYFFD